MSVIIREDDHTPAGRRNGNVINSRNADLPPIRQVDNKGHERG